MAEKTTKLGANVDFMVGDIVVGCVDEISLEMDVEQLSTKCAGSGKVNTYEPGNVDVKFSAKGVAKVYDGASVATNFSVDNFFAAAYAGTKVDIYFTLKEEGERRYKTQGYFKNVKKSDQVSDVSRYDISGWGNTWEPEEVPAEA